MPLGQNQKADVIGNQMQTAKFQGGRPANPGVPRTTLQGGGTPAQQRHPLLRAGGYIAEGLSYEGPESQVVMGVHQLSPARSLLATHRTNHEAGQVRTTVVGFSHGNRLANPKGDCQQKIECFRLLYFWDFDATLPATSPTIQSPAPTCAVSKSSNFGVISRIWALNWGSF